jgi:uncharacterized protein with PIN domain
MAGPGSKKDDEDSNEAASRFGRFKKKKTAETEYVTVKEEKMHLRRVMKVMPRSIKHASEANKASVVTQEDIDITEEVMDGIAPTAHEAPKIAPGSFNCVQCGAPLSLGADRCPRCNSKYVEVSDEDLQELESAEMDDSPESEDGGIVDKDGFPCVHFNAEEGTISYLEDDDAAPDFLMECSNCGTEIEFDTDQCPICGTKLNSSDTGIVSLFANMKFDEEKEDEMDCPHCGDHVTLKLGKCPTCSEIVQGGDPKDPSANIDPLIHTENVVFMHLDVETGELNFLQRLAKKLGFEQLTVQLDSINKPGFEQDWKSLSRI